MAERTDVPGRACQLCKYKVEIVQLTLNTSVWPIPPLNKQPLRPLTRTHAFQYLVYGQEVKISSSSFVQKQPFCYVCFPDPKTNSHVTEKALLKHHN